MAAATVALFCFLSLGCRCEEEEEPEPQAVDRAEHANRDQPPSPKEGETVQRLLSLASRCEIDHQGVVLDLGHPSVEARRGFRLETSQREVLPRRKRSGVSVAELDQLRTTFSFWLDQPIAEAEFSALVYGTRSTRIAAYVDGQRLGGARVLPDELQVVRIRSNRKIEPGRHELMVSVSKPRSGPPGTEVGWVRLGPRGHERQDHPPSQSEVLGEVTVAGQRREAIVLRDKSAFRCPVWIPEGAKFSAMAGIWGQGTGAAEVSIHTPDGMTHRLETAHISEDSERKWVSIETPLARFQHQLVDLELSVPDLSEGARLAFADPSIVSTSVRKDHDRPAKRAIVIVLSGLSRHHAPPEAGRSGLPVLNRLAAEGTQFPGYRLPSTYAPATIGSLLTGRDPWEHGVVSAGRSLRPAVATIAETVEAGGGRAAMFTGVPTSFAPYGFSRGFGQFVSISPVVDESAIAPLLRARKWLADGLKEEGPTLLVVHLRGAHPPFDIPQEEARKLPPSEYGGDLDPRRAAIQLAQYRLRSGRRHHSLPEEDWQRLLAMQKKALLDQSVAIGRFLDWLQEQGAYQDSLIVVTSELGAGERPNIPFAEDAPLEGAYLEVPLVVKFPEDKADATRVEGTFTTTDVVQTIVAALSIPFDRVDPSGIDLGAGEAREMALLRPLVAYRDGHYATRQAAFSLSGVDGKAPALCNTALDPGCREDRSAKHPIAARALWHATFEELAPALAEDSGTDDKEPQPEHEAALTVWGVMR